MQRVVEIWCTAAGATLAGYFAWFTVGLVLESLEYGDVSPGMVPVALWIPQSAMALGLVILTISLLDSFVEALRGQVPAYARGNEDDDASGGLGE